MKKLTAKELQSKGGKACRDKYGVDFYREISKKYWDKKKSTVGSSTVKTDRI